MKKIAKLQARDDFLVAKDLWWWEKDMKNVQAAKKGPVPILVTKAHLPTKTGVPIHDVASSCGLEEWHQEIQTLNKTFSSHQFLQKLLSLTWTCPYKQTNKTILPSFSLTKSAPKARWNVIILLIINIQFSEMQEQYRHFYKLFFLV